MAKAIGVDIGGTGIKAGLVDLEHGHPRLATGSGSPLPRARQPADVLEAVKEVLDDARRRGLRVPARRRVPRDRQARQDALRRERVEGLDRLRGREVLRGRARTQITSSTTRTPPESRRPATAPPGTRGASRSSTTLGTGIGSAFLYDGVLLPNTELGHLHFARTRSIEKWAAYSAMEREKLDWADLVGASAGLLLARRVPVQPRPVRGRRRRLQAPGEVPARCWS